MTKKGAVSIVFYLVINSIFAQTDANKTSQVSPSSTTSIVIKSDKENQLYLFTQVMPSFPGGEEKLKAFLQKNFIYPEYEREHGITGTVNVSFVVEKDGRLTDVKVVKGVPKGSGCDEEGVRLVKLMTKWNPGTQGGEYVRVQMSLPIIFSSQKPSKPQETVSKPKPKSTIKK